MYRQYVTHESGIKKRNSTNIYCLGSSENARPAPLPAVVNDEQLFLKQISSYGVLIMVLGSMVVQNLPLVFGPIENGSKVVSNWFNEHHSEVL